MTAALPLPSIRQRLTHGMRGAGHLAFGVVVTWGLMTGLSLVQKPSLAPPPPLAAELRSVELPVQPPPPPREQTEPEPLAGQLSNLVQLEAVRSNSPVKLPVLPELPETVPPVLGVPRVEFAPAAFKPAPAEEEFDNRHVYAKTEVDQRCMPLLKVRPQVTAQLLRAARVREVAFMFIVNKDGSVENIWLATSSGSPELDEISSQAIRQWKFSPALRKGRKVRQWVRQSIEYQLPASSPFEPH
jgi:protein TonB